MGTLSDRILDAVLAGDRPSTEEVDALLIAREDEGQRLDYKAGGWLHGSGATKPGHPTAGAALVRKWVTGFANAVGGLLVLGVDAEDKSRPWQVTGEKPPVQQPFEEWCGRAIQQLVGISPPPRCCVVTHPRGDVALIATPRARSLVACVEQGELVHYFRIGDSTVASPAYLLTDLQLGRRQQPNLRASKPHLALNGSAITANLLISNHSMVWAPAVRVGFIALAHRQESELPLVPELDFSVVVEAKKDDAALRKVHIAAESMEATRGVRATPELAPFESKRWYATLHMPFFIEVTRCVFAGYVIAPNAPPTWFEVDATVKDGEQTPRSVECREVGDGPARIGFAAPDRWWLP
jgi:hypothetical protein